MVERDKDLKGEKSYYYIVTVILRTRIDERKHRIILFFLNLIIEVTRIYHSLLNLRKKNYISKKFMYYIINA